MRMREIMRLVERYETHDLVTALERWVGGLSNYDEIAAVEQQARQFSFAAGKAYRGFVLEEEEAEHLTQHGWLDLHNTGRPYASWTNTQDIAVQFAEDSAGDAPWIVFMKPVSELDVVCSLGEVEAEVPEARGLGYQDEFIVKMPPTLRVTSSDIVASRINIITEAVKKVEPVEWPTNLAWRIEFKQFAKVHPLLDIRRGKLYALPFRNWEDTFYKLTLKEATKVKFMDTSVVEVPPDALVGDMRIIDRALAHLTANDPTGARERDAIAAAQPYLEKAVPYSEFVHSPDMFERPEILLDRATTKFLPYRVMIADYVRGEGYRLGLAPKR